MVFQHFFWHSKITLLTRTLFCLLATSVSVSHVAGQSGVLSHETILVDGLEREYFVYVPAHYSVSQKWPLILAFHGGSGTAKGAIKLYNFNPLADNEGFIVVYPDGINKGWNDGRIAPGVQRTADDVKFVSNLIDKLIQNYSVDSRRIFSTGISNGAIFSIYLAYKIPGKILAIAPVSGSMPANLEKEFKLSLPVSALFINGTEDKLVKYDGGPVLSERSGRGEVIAVEKLILHWVDFNGCKGMPKEMNLPDLTKNDNCTASMKTYIDCSQSSEVVFVKIQGGGHTWPGGLQYAPRFLVGEVCRDFHAEEMIWDFFKRQQDRRFN